MVDQWSGETQSATERSKRSRETQGSDRVRRTTGREAGRVSAAGRTTERTHCGMEEEHGGGAGRGRWLNGGQPQGMGGGPKKDQGIGERYFSQGSSVGGDHGAVGAEKKSGLNLGQRGERVSLEDRQSCIEMVEQAKASGRGAKRRAQCWRSVCGRWSVGRKPRKKAIRDVGQ